MIYMTVTAHPDDEILGFGASSFVLSQQGHSIVNVILSGNVDARKNRPDIPELLKQADQARLLVGAEPNIYGSFPNIQFNTIPHLEIVQFIEKQIEFILPDVVLTHHPYDLNNDHQHTSKACQAAFRLFQRKEIKPIQALYFMEILSSTEWNSSLPSQAFTPNTFVQVGKEGIEKKIKSLDQYVGVLRDYPHPRSPEAINGLAALRGSQAGLNYAESFQAIFLRKIL